MEPKMTMRPTIELRDGDHCLTVPVGLLLGRLREAAQAQGIGSKEWVRLAINAALRRADAAEALEDAYDSEDARKAEEDPRNQPKPVELLGGAHRGIWKP